MNDVYVLPTCRLCNEAADIEDNGLCEACDGERETGNQLVLAMLEQQLNVALGAGVVHVTSNN